jgi:Zn-dependent oligopeptidase
MNAAHPNECICRACRNARIVAHARSVGAVADENAKLPAFELRAAIKLQRAIASAGDAAREMALRLMNREEQLHTDDAAKLANVARKLEEVAADLEALTSR